MAKLLLGSVVGPQGPQGTPGVNGSQGPQGIPGPNEVTATTDVVGLTSGQLLYNNGGKVGSVEIVDNLETEASNKPLSSKMGAWLGYFKRDMEDRGYLFAKSKTHFDFANTSGKYKISDASDQPVPGVTASWLVDVTNNGEGGMVQIANCVKGDATVLGKTYRRIYISTGGGWQAWKEIPDKSYVDSAIGQTANLKTFEKSNLVGAINEIAGVLRFERYGVKIAKANSSPAGAMEYMYDAVGKQPAYMNFATGNFNYGDWADAFFIKQNRPVMLDASWNVVEELDKTDQTKKTDGSPSSISDELSNLNAFAEFPQVWYKTWEDSTHQYFAISNVQYDETYKCDVCKDATGKIGDKWYFPMYDGSLISGKMRSLADKSVSVSKTAQQEIDYCKANGASWYTLDKEQIHVFVMLAELIAKNRNSQQAFGDQVSLATNTAGINTGSLKSFGQFKGYNDGIHATKMFYCETGSLGYFMRYAGHVTNATKEQLIKTFPPYNIDGSGYVNVGSILAADGYIKEMTFNEHGIFAKSVGGAVTTYWPDYSYSNPSCYARWRGNWNNAATAGLRGAFVATAASYTYSNIASALSGRKPV